MQTESEIRTKAEVDNLQDIDAIRVYGSSSQNILAEVSKTVSRALANAIGSNTDQVLSVMIGELERLALQKKPSGLLSKNRRNDEEDFKNIIRHIDKMVVDLRLRQALLLKDIKIYDRMEEEVIKCCEEISIYIDVGDRRLVDFQLQEHSQHDGKKDLQKYLLFKDKDELYSALGRKIDELRTTHIISMRCLSQIQLMKHNYTILSDRIGALIANVIPLWRNQVTMAYGLDLYEKNSSIQDKLTAMAERTIKENERNIKKKKKLLLNNRKKEIDIDKIRSMNAKLEQSIQSLIETERSIQRTEQDMEHILCEINSITI